MSKRNIRLMIYPLAGLLCIGIGIVIINATLNVHSGEIFLWLLGIFGFLLIFPAVFFANSIQILRKSPANERSWTKSISILLTTTLAILWVSLIIMAFMKDW
jgi:hypothetical protein